MSLYVGNFVCAEAAHADLQSKVVLARFHFFSRENIRLLRTDPISTFCRRRAASLL